MNELIRYVINHTEKGDERSCATCTRRWTDECHSVTIRNMTFCLANEPKKEEFTDLVYKKFPGVDKLLEGMSHEQVKQVLGDQTLALRFMGLGAILGVWKLIGSGPPKAAGINRKGTPTDAGDGPVFLRGFSRA